MEDHEAVWNNKMPDGMPSSLCGILKSFCDIQKAPWHTKKQLWNNDEI